jgi:hypothetical protein
MSWITVSHQKKKLHSVLEFKKEAGKYNREREIAQIAMSTNYL